MHVLNRGGKEAKVWACLMPEEAGKVVFLPPVGLPEKPRERSHSRKPLGPQQMLSLFFNCGQFLDHFHVYNQGIIITKNTLGNRTE